MSFKNPRKTKQLRRDLRQNMTEPEKLLWERVRNKQLCGIKARRQYGIGPYVLDFYIPKAKLAIEVDGKIHLSKEVKENDINKDAFLNRNGIHVIRIKNEDVVNEIDDVITKLEVIVSKRLEE
ncbi:MAG: endonuclease domain-containing protein [Gracilimonas sp.]